MSLALSRARRSLTPHRLFASLGLPAASPSCEEGAPLSRELGSRPELDRRPHAHAAAQRAVGSAGGACEAAGPAGPWPQQGATNAACRDGARAEAAAANTAPATRGGAICRAAPGSEQRGRRARAAARAAEQLWRARHRRGLPSGMAMAVAHPDTPSGPRRRMLSLSAARPTLALSAAAAMDSAGSSSGGGGGGGGGGGMEIFNRRLKAMQRDRAAADMASPPNEAPRGDPLVEQVASVLLDRLADCSRSFSSLLLLGAAALPSVLTMLLHTHPGIQRLVVMDISPAALALARSHLPPHAVCCNDSISSRGAEWSPTDSAEAASAAALPSTALAAATRRVEVAFVLADEEHLPFARSSFDAVIACLGLHWVNDLPGAMTQLRTALKPDGLFLAAMLGGDTLRELRIACTLAHMERQGGVAARVAPMAQVRDAGNLLTRAGFALPTVDVDDFPVAYPSAIQVVQHLRSLGETDCTLHHGAPLPRDTALAAAAIYSHMFPCRPPSSSKADSPPDLAPVAVPRAEEEKRDDEIGVLATFQVIFMAGWSPHESQQRARPRGSATVSLHELQRTVAATH
ncbi:hypothetical protein CLOM_g3546 [Closterium sp. NIES-68]|nr:hypothetical protein CLOM_g3546 [Closterium sp. NIES-68]GJP69822.1 hypothetical protein CLOP_g834 [Closterium sp. NIES-67]